LGAGVFTERLAELAGEARVPGGSQGDAAGIGGGWSPAAHADGGVGHFEAGQVDGWGGVGVHVVDAADQFDLLFKRELLDPGMGLGFDGR
jgi:hypothetical protein